MAKFRRNHTQSGNFFSSSFVRLIAFILIGGFAVYYITRSDQTTPIWEYEVPPDTTVSERFYLPEGADGQVIHHQYYSLSYNEKYEQADWVAYELTKASIVLPNVEREREFRPDYSVQTGSAFHRDYTRSGYTRGHLAPAGDMAFDTQAMKESFYMSNMSPQLEEFNGGVWRELEEVVRDWAYDNQRLYVVTGPVLSEGIIKRIGDNRVGVPKKFFKVAIDIDGRDRKGIGFILENRLYEEKLQALAVSIDSVEALTGFDFFNDLLSDEVEEEIESRVDVGQWRFDQKRFLSRNTRYR